MMYAMNNSGNYPRDLAALTNIISDPELFLAPASGEDGGDMADVMEWTSRVDVPGAALLPPSADAAGSNTWCAAASQRVILAYLPRTQRSPYGLLLYQDGHLLSGTAQELTREQNHTLRTVMLPPAEN